MELDRARQIAQTLKRRQVTEKGLTNLLRRSDVETPDPIGNAYVELAQQYVDAVRELSRLMED